MANWAPVISDVIIVSCASNLPQGYTLVEPPFVIKETQEQRYLAYKKIVQSPKVFAVTDIMVKKDSFLVPPGYKTLTYTTLDDLECFPDKLIMFKRDGWSPTLQGIPNAFTDIRIFAKTDRESMPFGYKMIHDINGLSICFKRSDLKYTQSDNGLHSSDEEDDDVFGELVACSDDDDFYEIPSSTKSKPSIMKDEIDGGSGLPRSPVAAKRNSKKIIRSVPITDFNTDVYGSRPSDSLNIVLSPLYTNLHLSLDNTGYPLNLFLTPPPSSMLCSQCNNVLRNPYLLTCCQSLYCETCLLAIQQSSNTKCRKCSGSDYDFHACTKTKDELELMLVRCSNSKMGCKWQGQLGEMEIHLFVSCSNAEIMCEKKCGLKFQRCDLDKHQCVGVSSPLSVTRSRVPLSYTRSASSVEELSYRITEIQMKQQKEMQAVKKELNNVQHTTKQNTTTESNYSKLSFEVKALKKQLGESLRREQLMEKKLKEHEEQIQVLKETHNIFRLQFDNLIDQLQNTKSIQTLPQLPMSPVASPTTLKQPPCEFVIEQFDRYLSTPDSEWYSDPFVSDIRGYKFCLQVVPHGMMSSAGSDISVCVKLMRGDHDDQLKWPFQGKIVVQILNWLCDQRHASRTIEFNADARRYGACGRVPLGCIGDRAAKGWGILPFLPHGYLPFNRERNTKFMKDNCVCIRVMSVTQS